MKKITDYLYEVTFDNYEGNYEQACTFFEKYKIELGGCSSVQNGKIRGRNYDWVYDEAAEFVVHIPASEGRHASVGVAATTSITNADVEAGRAEAHKEYQFLPYMTLDGINDAGLTVNINVVMFGDKGPFKMKTADTSDDVFPLMACRLMLDKAGTVEEAIELMQNMDLYSIGNVDEAHFMISGINSKDDDRFNTVVVELIPDEEQHYQISVVDYLRGEFVDDKPIMTNFYLSGFDGSEESLNKHPAGYERYQILAKCFEQGATVRGMKQLMKKVFYTNAYDLYHENFWYTEFMVGDLTMDKRGERDLNGDVSKAGAFADTIGRGVETFIKDDRTSNKSGWHTVHTSVYDIDNRKLHVMAQESDVSYEFEI